MFTVEQQSHVVYPRSFELGASNTGGGGGGHRRTQRTGERLYIQIATTASTPGEAEQAVEDLVAESGALGGGESDAV